MFYSQIFLARKGPLGTVWIAAHLQHKLRKSHYTSTNIPSTVERIMFPALPIALRMSSHLLLGVVRIYAKKVDYLHHDCNRLWVSLNLSNASRPVKANLVETTTNTNTLYNAVTIPETFLLDAMIIDPIYDLSEDNHLKSKEEITLTDQHSPERDPYVRITMDNDVTPESSHPRASPHGEIDSMQIDSHPQEPVTAQGLSSIPQTDNTLERFEEGSSLADIPDMVEHLREHPVDFTQDSPMDSVHFSPRPNTPPSKNTLEKEVESSLQEHTITSEAESPQLSERPGPPSALDDVLLGGFDSLVNGTQQDFTLQPSPPPEIGSQQEFTLQPSPPPEIPQRRQRKRKQYFDKDLVLTNQFVKRALNDTSDIVRKREKFPSSALEMWRFRNKKKTNIFSESLTSGLCDELQSIPTKDLTSVRINLIPSEVGQQEERASESLARTPSSEIVIERLRHAVKDDDVHNSFLRERMHSPLPVTPRQSSGNDQTFPSSLHTVSESGFETDPEPRFGNLSYQGMFTGSGRLDMEDLELRINSSNAGLSDNPDFRISEDLDGLSFLEQDNNTSPDSQGSRQSDAMSVRTRAVAQFLKNHSPLSNNSGSTPEKLSLFQILEGRTKTLSARMFYEILVLKTCDVIDAKQENAYGDITLKLKASLSKANI